MNKIVWILLGYFFCVSIQCEGQVDPHFSQYYAYPMWLNPGLTGVSNGDYRATAIYRKQWGAVMVPYSTAGISADVATEKNLNFGINLLNQTAGDAGYSYQNAYLSIAYSGVKFGSDKNHQLTIGIQAGMLGRKFDRSKMQFGDQWNPITGYDPSAITSDDIQKTSATTGDVGVGISYTDVSGNKLVSPFGGVAAFHLTRPQDPFISSSVNSHLPVRYLIHAGARINISENAMIIPNLLYMRQGSASEKMVGFYGQMQVNDITAMLAGINYRFNDAIVPFAGIAYRNFLLGVSYDVNTSELGQAITGTNSLEISLTFTGQRPGKAFKYLSCPRF